MSQQERSRRFPSRPLSPVIFKKTGNIWTPAFLNAFLMTIMAIANTMVAFK